MLRTKLSHVDEGGVAAGLGALDSILLVDAEGCCADDEGNPCGVEETLKESNTVL